MAGAATARGEREHVAQLDGLRAIAVAAVVVFHAWPARLPALAITPRILGLGRFGVDLFFVLSGFLITSILVEARDRAAATGTATRGLLGAFYARRFLRIFPLYYLALAVYAVTDVPGADPHLGWNLAYLGNVEIARDRAWSGLFAHFWSLSVEEQFYLVWPWIVLAVPARRRLVVFTAIAGLGPAWRIACHAGGWGPHAASVLPMGCLDDLAGGAVLAQLATVRVDPAGRARFDRAVNALLAIGLAAVAVHVALDLRASEAARARGTMFFYRTSIAIAGMGVVGTAVRGWPGATGRWLASAPVTYVGRVSYGVYVLHPFAGHLLARAGYPAPDAGAAGAVHFAAVCAVTLALASASWFLYERPLIGLKRRFPYFSTSRRNA